MSKERRGEDGRGNQVLAGGSEKELAAEPTAMTRLHQVSRRLVQAGDSTSLLQEIVDAAIALEAELADSQLLAEISTRLIPEGDVGVLLQEIITAAISVTHADMGTIHLLDQEEGELLLLASLGFERPYRDFFERLSVKTSLLCTAALESGRREVVTDIEKSPIHTGTRSGEENRRAGVRAVQSTPLIARSGRPVGVLSTHWRRPYQPAEREMRLLDQLARQAADLIERHQAHAEREELLKSERLARAESERAAQLKDDFLATLSHELRTPLNAILGWTQLIRTGSADPKRVLRGIEVIERNARAQAQLIGDLLDLSRIITGKLRLNVQRVELSGIIDAALEAVRPAAEARGIQLHREIEPITQPVHGDGGRLQQILWNLLSNAVKFTPEGGRVQVVLSRAGSQVEIRVSDTGSGIHADFLPYVFERFRQADASATREHGGLGIGLALVKQLTELHGGEVRAASDGAAKGSTFTVKLPLAILPAKDEDLRQQPRAPAWMSASVDESAPHLKGIKVLAVDDEPDTLEVIQRILEDRGAEVTTIRTAEEALAALDGEQFDILLSDIGMPKRDGYDFIVEVRKRGVKAPATAVTAYARSEDRARALLSGYQAHLTKPVEPAELLATVASLSGKFRL
jgi:signal transduction histidine kinase/CheY-like chemotaxis protein